MPRSYSIGEFADELGVHAQTVKRWCRNDDLDRDTSAYPRLPVSDECSDALSEPRSKQANFTVTLR
ncbi:MAG: hypothetical protein ACI8XM_000956 [Haloarculaceae archaeon]|jgi:hypothetical protein